MEKRGLMVRIAPLFSLLMVLFSVANKAWSPLS